MSNIDFLEQLEQVIEQRLTEQPESSYTASLARGGLMKVAQKVGEEAVEVALAAVAEDTQKLTGEAADLIFHLLLLLRLRELRLADVCEELVRRHRTTDPTMRASDPK